MALETELEKEISVVPSNKCENHVNNELIISLAFPPISTTSSNVVAKKILLNKRKVSVICGKLEEFSRDESLSKIVSEYVEELMVMDVNGFNFPSGLEFVKQAIPVLNKKPTYDNVYSRAQFMPSHLLAYYYKISHDTYWTAEFSDPVIWSLTGDYLSSPINNEKLVEEINKTIPKGFDKIKNTDTNNALIQYLTFIFADEIIFTNENQREIMVNDFPNLKEMVLKKSRVERHPILEEKYYYIKNSDYSINDNYINFAYFGVLYGNRNFEEFINGFDNMADDFKDKFRLHVFTPNKEMFKQVLTPEILSKTMINSTVDYFEFLNLTTKMDVLLVEDTFIKDIYPINPFLPSKYADYKGSGTDIWAICDKGSIMDEIDDIKYKSYLNDVNSSKNAVNQIMSDKLSIKVDSPCLTDNEIIEYYKKRHVDLVNNINALLQQKDKDTDQIKFYQQRIQEYKEYNAHLRKWLRPKFLVKILKRIRNFYKK